MNKKINVFLLLIIFSFCLMGCSKNEEKEQKQKDIPNARETFFEELESLSKFEEGEIDVKIESVYFPEEFVFIGAAEPLISANKKELGLGLNGKLEKNRKKIDIIFSSSELNIEDLEIGDIILIDNSIYLNKEKLINSLGKAFDEASNKSFQNYSVPIQNIEQAFNILKGFENYSKNPYISLGMEDIGYLFELLDKEDISIDEKTINNIIDSTKKIIQTITFIEKEFLMELFKEVEKSYETSIIKYDTEEEYLYIEMNSDLFNDFGSKLNNLIKNENICKDIYNKIIQKYNFEMLLKEFQKNLSLLQKDFPELTISNEIDENYIIDNSLEAINSFYEQYKEKFNGVLFIKLKSLEKGHKFVFSYVSDYKEEFLFDIKTSYKKNDETIKAPEFADSIIKIYVDITKTMFDWLTDVGDIGSIEIEDDDYDYDEEYDDSIGTIGDWLIDAGDIGSIEIDDDDKEELENTEENNEIEIFLSDVEDMEKMLELIEDKYGEFEVNSSILFEELFIVKFNEDKTYEELSEIVEDLEKYKQVIFAHIYIK